ncbi:tyrosine-type recombinase/integrase [Nocardia sp. NPDC057440]|uniref:tyrosine-type recombinase/integrase n=1 Tax=Nocardia sp. NPDC057440 TaxID=3346134 RepID=UPI003671062E
MPPKKKRRRPRGEGSIYQRASDEMWIGAIWYEDEFGEERRASVARADKGDLVEEFRELRNKIAKGEYKPRSKMSVEKWFDYWVEEMVKPHRAPKTYKSYRDTIDNQIVPFVGGKRLPVAPADIRGNLKKVGEQWSPRTAELTYAVWSVAMKAAKKEGVITSDPTESVTKPMNNASSGKALTSDQARRVLLSALESGDRMVTRWATAFFLGARQGECLGLERARIDMKTLTVDTSWQLQSLATKPGFDLDDPDRFDVPKGYELRPLYRRFALTRRKGQRPVIVPLPTPLAAILEVYLESTPVNRFGLVWVSDAGTPIPGKTDNEAWHEALKRAGVPEVRLHDARHTTATLLLEMGVEESVRMQIMGQSTVAAQRKYAHVDLSLARKALGNLNGLLSLE